MSIQSQINRIATAIEGIKEALNSKGASIPTGTKVDGISTYILGIQTLTNVNVTVNNQSSGQVGVFYHTIGEPSCSQNVLNTGGQTTVSVALGSLVIIRLATAATISLSSGMGGSSVESLSGVAGVYAAPVNAGGTITIDD